MTCAICCRSSNISRASCERLGRLAWLTEELAALGDAQLLHHRPRTGVAAHEGPARAGLRARAARARACRMARTARHRAQSPPRLDSRRRGAARDRDARAARRVESLADVPELSPGTIKHSGEELLAHIRAAEIPDPPPPLNLRVPARPCAGGRCEEARDGQSVRGQGAGAEPRDPRDATRSRAAGRRQAGCAQ